ncbi:MAG TPA: ABC transporter ATP-binding protein [Lachnospiraceae bacterium]|nr:ATP-binding cassette domain-containing protein [uncultured Lachnoclostridium sp.]HAU86560.1 ABC transporter ATP-binding protein [Lachnospiraceae bacterium]
MTRIICKDITLFYKSNIALKNVNLKIEQNGLYGIVGASGSGKSSLLYSLAGFKNNNLRGEIWYDDVELTKLKNKQILEMRRKDFGFIFQKHFLIPYLNVLDNVLVSSNDYKNREKALEYLDKLGIQELAKNKIYKMSGGECQRVAIARALVNDSKVIFADEPTAALDSTMTQVVMKMLKEISKERVVFIVTHDRQVFDYFDRTIELYDGAIVDDYKTI